MKFSSKTVFLIWLNLVIPIFLAVSQNLTIDSLTNALDNAKEDTSKVDILYNLSTAYETVDPGKYKEYTNQGYLLAVKLNYKRGIANSLYALELIDYNNGNYTKALSLVNLSLEIWKELKDKSRISDCLNTIGTIYKHQGDFEKAIDYFQKSLALRIEIKDALKTAGPYNNLANVYVLKGNYDQGLKMYMQALAEYEKAGAKENTYKVFNNIGIIYFFMKDYPKALDYYQQALNGPEKGNVANAYSNMGDIYIDQHMPDKAEEALLKALKIYEDLDNKDGIANALCGLAGSYSSFGKLEKATNYYFRSLKMAEELGDKNKICSITIDIAKNYRKQKDFKRSLEYGRKALFQAEQQGIKFQLQQCYNVLYETCKELGDYEKSLEYYKLSTEVKDSMFNREKTKSIIELQTKYETEKKVKMIELLMKDNELKEKEFREQKIIRSSLIGGLILLFILLFTLYKRYRFKRKANLLLENQKKEIEQKNILITDSIDYAKTIQEAILPSYEAVKAFFPSSFIFYKPKAIVSGDFYWVGESDTKIICAVADCTGHGIPGAFMSLLGNNMLENVVKKTDPLEPAKILNSLNEELITFLGKNGERSSVKNGMDIALITVDKTTGQLEYAGAHNSLYLIHNGELSEIKADKISIGSLNKGEAVHFTNNTRELQRGDIIYMFSDGYADQIGGPGRKKFYYQPFKDLLISISKLEMDDQKKKLDEVIAIWKGERDQTDDILVVGIKF